ncbi:transketolase, partial [bacterium]|nr:transketolase [bacterium]
MKISIKQKEASTIAELKSKASKIRKDIVRMITEAKSGHPGGSLSAVDVATALYFKVMRHNPKDPKWKDRDRFILSKGHAAPLLYSVLAESGYFE